MFCSKRRVWRKSGEAVRKLLERAAETVVFLVVAGFLDIVAANYCCVSVVVVPCIRCKVDFSQERLLVVLEFSDHDASMFRSGVVMRFCGEVEIFLG